MPTLLAILGIVVFGGLAMWVSKTRNSLWRVAPPSGSTPPAEARYRRMNAFNFWGRISLCGAGIAYCVLYLLSRVV